MERAPTPASHARLAHGTGGIRADLGRLRARLGRPLSDPRMLALAGSGAAVVVVALRVAVAGHGHVGSLVLVGSRFVAPGAHLAVPVIHGNGYDGQFYYRQALDPLDFSLRGPGILMDSPQRYERVAYPALAWALSLGHASLVPWTLIAVNVVGLGVLAWMGGVLARAGGRHPAWGLLLPGYFGFVWSLSRDLTEIVETVFLVAGLLALRRGRPVVAGVVLSVAVLARETALVVVAAVALVQLLRWWRKRGSPSGGTSRMQVVAWVLPVVAFAGWQSLVRSKVGHFPLVASGQHNLSGPFVGLVHGVTHYAPLLPSHDAVLWFAELVVLAAVVARAGLEVRHGVGLVHERLAWAGFALLAVCLAPNIWLGDVGFRSLDDVYVLSVVILLASPRRVRFVAPVMALAWVVVAAELVKVI